MPGNSHFIALLVLMLCSSRTLCAQPASDHTPRLTVATTSGQSTFHIGERIPLTLSFTGPADNSFGIDLANYDRSGRMYEDTFNVEPQSGWQDPLATYFRFGAGIGGGIRGGQNLSAKPVTLNANLNEWVRFDEPGTYILTVTSHRVGPTDEHHHGFPQGKMDVISSNSVKLTIVPATIEWQDKTLSRIIRDLPKKQNDAVSHELPAAQADAMSDLRFFATSPGVGLLAAQLRDDGPMEWNAYFGLIGLPHEEREQAIRSMRSLLSRPDFPVGTMFLEAMSWLRMPEDHESSPNEQTDRKTVELYSKRRLEARNSEWQNAILGLHEKEGAALHATESALLESAPLHPDSNSAAVLAKITRASFAKLSPSEQTRALQEHWDLIGSRELLPQLREIAKAPPAATDATAFFFSPRARIVVALQRWYELEPESAAAETIRQIGQAYPQLYANEVSYLNEKTFPQFETEWAKTLAEGKDINDYEPAASLLLRFGTGTASLQMIEILHHPQDNTENRLEPAIAYLLKFDESAVKLLLQQDPKLLEGRLDRVAKQTSPSAFLTAAALDAIAGSDANATADALNYLCHYGDEKVREPIYKALLIWHERYKSLAGKPDHDLSREQQSQLDLGHAFFGALLGNQGWIPDAKLKSDVLLHMIGPSVPTWEEMASKENLNVTMFEGDYASYEIGPFDAPNLKLFEEKLDQFPTGTTFFLQHVSCPEQHSQDLLEASLPKIFLNHGMKLLTPDSTFPTN